jgi:AcrR family transcriptional regulator
MSDGFARRKEQSKEEIRKAAWELFSQFGVEKVSMMDIARKAGVSQATIYNNFGSKDALAREFVTMVIDQLVRGGAEALSPNRPFWEKMAVFIQFISEMMARGRLDRPGAPVFGLRSDLLDDPEIARIRASAQEKMIALLIGLVREGKAQGQVRGELSEEAFEIYFVAFMEIFTGARFRQMYARNPNLVHELGMLMIDGMRSVNRVG